MRIVRTLLNFCCTIIENQVCVREKGSRRRDRERLPHASHLLAVAQLLLVSIYKWLLS